MSKIIEDIECIYCSKIFWAYERSVCLIETTCGGCYLNNLPWYTCKDCRMRVSTVPCFICERGYK